MKRVLASLSLLLLLAGQASAQQPGVEFQIETRTIEVGETIAAQLVCTNTEQPSLPITKVPDGITLQLMNPTPSMSSMTSFINGQQSSQTTYTFPYRLTASKPGTYVLGPFTVDAGSMRHQTQAVQLIVRESSTIDEPVGDQLVFVRVEVDRRSIYVTESLKAALTIGIRKVYMQNQVFEYDRLLRSVDASASTLAGFGPQFSASELKIKDSSGVEHEYMIYRDTKEIRGDEVGPLNIGPIFLKVEYPTSFRRSFWGRGLEPSQTTRVTARADAIGVEVKGPPADGRPNDFTGAIGQFTIAAAARPSRVVQGQPLTLKLSIRGKPVEGVAGPDLNGQPDLVSRFEFASDELRGDVEQNNTKVFRRAIFPRQPGEQTIPSITWSYFDPKAQRYVTLATDPIDIVVDPPADGAVPTVVALDAGSDPEAGRLTVLQGGVSPNVVDRDLLLANQGLTVATPELVLVVGVPPLAYLLLTLLLRHRTRLRADRGYARRRGARARARSAIAAALTKSDGVAPFGALAAALVAFLSDMLNLPPGEHTAEDVASLLEQRGLPADLRREIVGFLRTCEAVRYSSGAIAEGDAQSATGQIQKWIGEVEKHLG